MITEEELRLKLRKVEALFEGAGTSGERNAAEAAIERSRQSWHKLQKPLRLLSIHSR